MTTFPSNRNQDWTATQAAPWQTPSPDAARPWRAYFPPTAARPAAPVHGSLYGPAFGQRRPTCAWSAEQPEFNSAPAAYPTQRSRGMRVPACWPSQAPDSSPPLPPACSVHCTARRQHPGEHRRPERTGTCTGPSTGTGTRARRPAGGAQLPVDVPLDGVERRIHRAASHQAPPQAPPAQPSGDQSGQSYHDSGSDPSQWNNSGNYSVALLG